MTRVDQFESVFKAAAKQRFRPERPEFRNALVITDLDTEEARRFGDQVRSWLPMLAETEWRDVAGDEFHTVDDILALVGGSSFDLICTYRNLHSTAWQHSFTIGEHLAVLTQATPTPILVLPHPGEPEVELQNTDAVMALTDHLTGDDRLVNHAARFAQEAGTLFLTHVEDQATVDRMLGVIEKIPSIDTDNAREEILNRLLKEPHDYIRSCREGLEGQGGSITIEEIVVLGHHLDEHKRLIEEHAVDLLVLNTKDDDQLAMHGLAYPLAVELRRVPLLML